MAGVPIPTPLPLPNGPIFIDTASCQCALQANQDTEPNKQSQNEAWRCTGNATENMYAGKSGKWFFPVNEGSKADLNQTFNSANNPPDTTQSYILEDNQDNTTAFYTPFNATDYSQLSIFDQACTGQNDTQLSGPFYQALADTAAGKVPPTARLCAAEGAVPITIQNASSWNDRGCNLGFLCERNSINRLPQYCPPRADCQHGRLAGATCPPMGYLEPVICKEGNYCPPSGQKSIRCPAGHFCSKGAYEPTPCSFGANCPPGSERSMSFLPLILLIILDILLVGWTFGFRVFTRRGNNQKHNKRTGSYLTKAISFVNKKQRPKNYQSLEDGDILLEPRISHIRHANTGFSAAMDAAFLSKPSTIDFNDASSNLQLFVQSLSKCIGTSKFGLSFEFVDLKFQPKHSTRPILSEVTGQIQSGSLSAVMGASGAGKSTFVNVLMGKQAHTGGTTKINGVAGNISKFKKIIGYVPQDDILLAEMTVRENILHSARMRLPCDWTDVEIQKHVDILISCLQLEHVKDSVVGNAAAPVISGGQRKRVSIGMELTAAPMALFLDEPTSGLDATSASSIMTTLKALSRLGITVVTIIHQPRQEIFESLDTVLLFAAGRMIYQGPESNVQNYFENVGFHFPAHGNPADTVMDIIAGQGHIYKKFGDTGVQSLIEYWHNRQHSLGNLGRSTPESVPENLVLRQSIKRRGAHWHRQIYFCFIRSIIQQFRLKSSFYAELGVGALAGFLIGLAELNQNGINFRGIYRTPYELLSSSIDYASVPQMALLVGLAIGLTASSPGVKIFGEEKLVYWREAASGHNRLAYYIGKVLSTFPRMILANIHFSTTFLLLSTPRIPWGAAFIANLFYFYCIYGLAACVSVITRREDGPLLAVMTSLIVGVINGMSPSLKVVTGWHMSWLWRASPGTWLSEGYFTENISPYRYLYDVDDAAKALGYRLGHFGLDLAMLCVLGTAYRVLAFFGLRFLNRQRQK